MADERDLEKRVQTLEAELARLKESRPRGVRWRSRAEYAGLPLVSIAVGPDPNTGRFRGHARGVVAIGDIATGVLAVGGLTRGVVALGGVAAGLFSFGGLSLGLLVAVGGLAIGGAAFGGAAVGGLAVGGGAVGYYACGGGAAGAYVLDSRRQDLEVARFFEAHGVPNPCPVPRLGYLPRSGVR